MSVRRIQPRHLLLAFSLLAFLGIGAFLGLTRLHPPAPRLDGLEPLLAESRHDEVERRLGEYLLVYPDHIQANMLMAQVALTREDQKPSVALKHLNRIKTGDRTIRAVVLLNRGKAYSELERFELAESSWKEAIRIDPRVPDAGWNLLGLYYVQGRRQDVHGLAMSLFGAEPDPRDQAQLLLEILRQDAQPLGSDSAIKTFEPVVRVNPADLYTSLALGIALIRASRIDEGLARLRDALKRSPDSPDAWKALLLGLDEGARPQELAAELARLPAELAADNRFERFKGSAAQDRRDWAAAADAYLRAWRVDPSEDSIVYRLALSLRAAGRLDQATEFDGRVHELREVRRQILAIYEEANAVRDLGAAPHPDLCHRLAELRERMGRDDEALAWHRLVLRDKPDDPISAAAVDRLGRTIKNRLAGPTEATGISTSEIVR